MRRGLNVVLNCLSWRLIPSLYGSFKVIYTYYLFLLIWCLTFCLRVSFLKFLAHTLLPHLFFFKPFYLTSLRFFSLCYTLLSSVVAHHSCVKWGHNLCVWVAPPILMSTHFCPLCAAPGPGGKCAHSQGRVDKALWAHGCNIQNARETITLYLCRRLLERSCWGAFALLALASICNMFCLIF